MPKKGPTGNFFFQFFNFFPPKVDNIFQPNQKKNGKKKNGKKLRPPDWPQLRPPAGQKTDFFLSVSICHTTHGLIIYASSCNDTVNHLRISCWHPTTQSICLHSLLHLGVAPHIQHQSHFQTLELTSWTDHFALGPQRSP